MLADIRAAADKEKIEFNEEQYNKSLPLIKTQLKALIARDLWDMNEYFQVINTTNNSVQQALELLNEKIYEKNYHSNKPFAASICPTSWIYRCNALDI